MKAVELKAVQTRLPDYIDSSIKEPVLILRDGKPIAMLVGLAANEKKGPTKLREVLRKAWQDYEEHGGIPHDQFWERLAKSHPARKRRRTGAK